jgi:hypothetical protein
VTQEKRKVMPKDPYWQEMIGRPTYVLIWVHQCDALMMPAEKEDDDDGFGEKKTPLCDPYVVIRLYKQGTNEVVREQVRSLPPYVKKLNNWLTL